MNQKQKFISRKAMVATLPIAVVLASIYISTNTSIFQQFKTDVVWALFNLVVYSAGAWALLLTIIFGINALRKVWKGTSMVKNILSTLFLLIGISIILLMIVGVTIAIPLFSVWIFLFFSAK